MAKYSKPVWQMVREAIGDLGDLTFRTATEYIDAHYPDDRVNRGTIQAQLVACSVNHPSAHHFNDPNRFLYYLGNGRYRQYNPGVDGEIQTPGWKILSAEPTETSKEAELEIPYARVENGNRIALPSSIIQKLDLKPKDIIAFMEEDSKIIIRKARLKIEVT
ncbi:MAG: AbrB/MazE/SpoVT family DNA-binding domain-containing protein [Thaumarchaeota archaeon]|nr:AbrB/MazE/SpoVT family DNA-binding domain-containing protein [Nitrososphaerota archaeon]